jgi:hypothetical protein
VHYAKNLGMNVRIRKRLLKLVFLLIFFIYFVFIAGNPYNLCIVNFFGEYFENVVSAAGERLQDGVSTRLSQ